MDQASTSTCKAAGNDTLSMVTTEYSKNRTSEQWSQESQHHAQAEEDKYLSCCFGWFPWFTSLFSTTAPKRRPGHFDRLSWQCAGHTEPGVVNSPTNKLDQNTHLHTYASCEESSSGSCLIRKPAGQALETPRTVTVDDDSQPAGSVDQPSTVGLGKFIESKCESGQTFDFKDGCILATTEIIVDTAESRSTHVAALSAFRSTIANITTFR